MTTDVIQVPSHALLAALTMLELVQDRIGSMLHDTEAQMLRVAIARQRECLLSGKAVLENKREPK